jgi:hypothetical protein
MKTIFSIVFLLIASTGFCAPWLICDVPTDTVTSYQFTGDAFFTTKAAEGNGSLRYDLAGIPSGSHAITVAACNMWGCSVTVPFEFSAATPSVPKGLRLVAQ